MVNIVKDNLEAVITDLKSVPEDFKKDTKPGFIKAASIGFYDVPTKDLNPESYAYNVEDFIKDEKKEDGVLKKLKEAGVTHLFLEVKFWSDYSENKDRNMKLTRENISEIESIDENLDHIENESEIVYDVVNGVEQIRTHYNHLTLVSIDEQEYNKKVSEEENITDKQKIERIVAAIKLISDAGIIPCIKIMNDSSHNNDSFGPASKRSFFKDYTDLTSGILNHDLINCTVGEDNSFVNNGIDTENPKKVKDVVGIITIANETGYTRKYLNYKKNWKEYINSIKNINSNIKISMSLFKTDVASGNCVITDLVDIIGFNWYPVVPNPEVPSVEEVVGCLYDSELNTIQQICESLDKKFMITEYACSPFYGQCMEPGLGNSMAVYYQRKENEKVQANYLKGGCIGFPMIDKCVGMNAFGLGRGGNYDWIYRCSKRGERETDTIKESYDALKSVWKDGLSKDEMQSYKDILENTPVDTVDINCLMAPYETTKKYYKLMELEFDKSLECSDGEVYKKNFKVYECSDYGVSVYDKTWDIDFSIYKQGGKFIPKLESDPRRTVLFVNKDYKESKNIKYILYLVIDKKEAIDGTDHKIAFATGGSENKLRATEKVYNRQRSVDSLGEDIVNYTKVCVGRRANEVIRFNDAPNYSDVNMELFRLSIPQEYLSLSDNSNDPNNSNELYTLEYEVVSSYDYLGTEVKYVRTENNDTPVLYSRSKISIGKNGEAILQGIRGDKPFAGSMYMIRIEGENEYKVCIMSAYGKGIDLRILDDSVSVKKLDDSVKELESDNSNGCNDMNIDILKTINTAKKFNTIKLVQDPEYVKDERENEEQTINWSK